MTNKPGEHTFFLSRKPYFLLLSLKHRRETREGRTSALRVDILLRKYTEFLGNDRAMFNITVGLSVGFIRNSTLHLSQVYRSVLLKILNMYIKVCFL